MPQNLNIEHFLKLTSAVYKVTELFPEKELKSEIRESANKVLAGLILKQYEYESSSQIKGGINLLINLFKEAEVKNWIDPRNFSVLYREYGKINEFLNIGKNSGKTGENSFLKNHRRQEKILEIVKQNGKVKVKDLNQIFPEFHRRTLIRDLDNLCQTGTLVRVGNNGRGVYYTQNNNVTFS